jgi:hypothetical protein
LPGDIGSAENEHAFAVATDTVHLYQQFGFDTSGGFRFTFSTRTAERIDFVDEDDRGSILTCEVK